MIINKDFDIPLLKVNMQHIFIKLILGVNIMKEKVFYSKSDLNKYFNQNCYRSTSYYLKWKNDANKL